MWRSKIDLQQRQVKLIRGRDARRGSLRGEERLAAPVINPALFVSLSEEQLEEDKLHSNGGKV